MTRRFSQDEGDENTRAKQAAPSTVHDLVTGGIENTAAVFGVEPLWRKLRGQLAPGESINPFKGSAGEVAGRFGKAAAIGAVSTGLVGGLVSLISKKRKQRQQQQDMEALQPGMIEFEDLDSRIPRAKSEYRKAVTAAGIGAAALGATTLPGASKFFGIRGRMTAHGLGFPSKNEAGRMVADYIEGAQLLLNRGVRGKVIGAGLQNALDQPQGIIRKGIRKAIIGDAFGKGEGAERLALEHYAAFRSSPMRALHFWDWEASNSREARWAKQSAGAKARGEPLGDKLLARRQRTLDELHYGREKVHNAIKEQVEVHGKNELEALKHVAYNNSDPQVQGYFQHLAAHKAKASEVYARKSLISPALIAGGGGAIVVGRKRNQTPKDAIVNRTPFRALKALEPKMIELDAYDPLSDRQLKSGVRLDKYEKTIKAHEIDRHIHDYLRASAIGAAAGAAIPASRSLKERSLAGAGAGLLVAGALHSVGHTDPYGEQSEEAKITQRNFPKALGGAVIVGGLLARWRAKHAAALKVVSK